MCNSGSSHLLPPVVVTTLVTVRGAATVRRAAGGASESVVGAKAATLLSEILGSSRSASTEATSATASASASVRGLSGSGLEELRNVLVGLLEDIDELSHNTLVASVEEGGGNTGVSGSASSTDSVDVIVNVGGEIVVNNVGNVGDIQASSSDGSGDQNRGSSVSEHFQSSLSVSLRSVSVNGGGGEVLALQNITEVIGTSLGLDEDQGQALASGRENVEQSRDLVSILNILDLLGDVLGGGTDTADRQEDVVLEEVSGQHLDVPGKGGGEHEGLSLVNVGHAGALDDGSDLGLETHIEHSVGLIKDKVLDVLQRDLASVDQIDESTGSSNKEVAASLNVSHLLANVGTTVDDARSDPGSVGELLGLVVDLRHKLSGGSKHKGSGVGLLVHVSRASRLWGGGGTVEEGLGQNGEEESSGLTRTGLGTGHQVSASSNNGDRVLLDGGGLVVSSKLDVSQQVLLEGRRGESVDGLGHVVTGGLDGNLVVVIKVDTGGLESLVVSNAEDFNLGSLVPGAGDMLTIHERALGGVSEATSVATVVTPRSTASTASTTSVASPVGASGVVLEGVGVLGVQVSASLSSVVGGGGVGGSVTGGGSLGPVGGHVLASGSSGGVVVQIQRLDTIFEFRHLMC